MLDFIYHNSVKVVFGKNKVTTLSDHIDSQARILILFGGGSIKQNGTYEKVIKALDGYTLFEFGGIEANPTYETLVKAIPLIKKEKIDFLLAIGGGSVIDGAKFLSAATFFEEDSWNIISKKAPIKKALPLGVVSTLPATGSEMNAGAVISRKETQEKDDFINELVRPKFAILDPTVTFSLPKRQVANGIIDAFVHTIEQYLTYPVNAPLQDRMAEGILLTLIEEGPKTLNNLKDYNSRSNLIWCATMALNNLIGCGVPEDWSSHIIGHEITVLYGLDHAKTLAIILPSLMEVMKDQKKEKLIQYGKRVWGLDDKDSSKLIKHSIQKTRDFFELLGVKTRFSAYQIDKDCVFKITNQLEKHQHISLGEQGHVNLEKVKLILENAL